MMMRLMLATARSRVLRGPFQQPQRPITIGIKRETYNRWERRAPLSPSHVEKLSIDHTVLVQPSSTRIFPDHAYQQAGAVVTDDLGPSDVILGVKRPVDPSTLLPNKTYLMFSHVIKGQVENMDLLQSALDGKVQLLDYECILQNGEQCLGRPKRLVAFGHYAGLAGATDALHGIGRRLWNQGVQTPLLQLAPTWQHDSLEQTRAHVRTVGDRIATEGLEQPLVISITGKGGSVHTGAMEMLRELPHEIVSVGDLPSLESLDVRHHQVYLCPVGLSDCYERIAGWASFDREDFAANPSEYRSVFAQRVAPYVDAIVNSVYWDSRYPRLLTKRQMRSLVEEGRDRIVFVADISCDVHGSMEFLERTTTIEQPFFQYDPVTGREVMDQIGETGVSVLGVDILPSELPRESSEHFGDKVLGVVRELAEAKEKQSLVGSGIDMQLLPPYLADACITTPDGTLAKGFRYLDSLLKRAPRKPQASEATMVMSLSGHLFDSGLINQVFDVVENLECGLQLEQCIFPPHSAVDHAKSSVLLRVTSEDESVLGRVEWKIRRLADLIENAEALVARVDHCKSASIKEATVSVEDLRKSHKVLLLGAGRVSKSMVEYLDRKGDNTIVVAADDESAARTVASASAKGKHVCIDIEYDRTGLSDLIEESDVVVSLLPAPMHPRIALECIMHKKDLVTASYESDEIRSMDDRAKAAGVVLLNEVGLDPGLDHMSSMKIIDDIKDRGGRVTCFSSVCGGLPAPEAANNPLMYKFSWSPKGVISASQQSARYRWEGRTMEVHGDELLHTAAPFVENWSELHLECLPNRDSLVYETVYGIEDTESIFRGTLRYRGFSSLMAVFQNMGLFNSVPFDGNSWMEVIERVRKRHGGFESIEAFVQACAEDDTDNAQRALAALDWLGMLDVTPTRKKAQSVVDAFSDVLERKLHFESHERDMVVMHHTVEASFPGGSDERHHSSLQIFGDDKMSAMAKTVGYTTAAATDLLLSGSLRGRCGLLLPTEQSIYEPVLAAVGSEGITFEESTHVHHPSIRQRG